MQTQYMINGRRDACLTPMDRGIAYGDGVFRTFRVKSGIPQCWDRHYARLSEDCNALRIVCPPAHALLGEIGHLCHEDAMAAVKVIVTRGESGRGYAPPPLAQPTRVVIKIPLPDYPERNFSEGVHLHLCETRMGIQPRLAGIKHLNRLENVLARMEWVDANLVDGLLLDVEGYVIECTMSNLFLRCGNTVITPDLSRCGVAGVTRQRILDILDATGCYQVDVARFDLETLLQADEVVICNSLFGVWQVRKIGDHVWPPGTLSALLRGYLESDDAPAA